MGLKSQASLFIEVVIQMKSTHSQITIWSNIFIFHKRIYGEYLEDHYTMLNLGGTQINTRITLEPQK